MWQTVDNYQGKLNSLSNYEFQDSLISDLEFVICEMDTEQKVVKKYSMIATIYAIIVTLFLLK